MTTHIDYAATIAATKKKYGDEAINRGDLFDECRRLPTGSLHLDYITGGGWPVGRCTMFFGMYSSGKTLFCWHAIKQAQKAGIPCFYYDLEKTFDKRYAESIGIDVSKLQVINLTEIEAVGEVMEALMTVGHGMPQLHVIDSISMGLARKEMEADVGADFFAVKARAWSSVLGKVMAAFDKANHMLFLISQARVVMGYAGGEQPTGGSYVAHNASLILHLKRSKKLYRSPTGVLVEEAKRVGSESVTEDQRPDGARILATVTKSKVCPPGAKVALQVAFDSAMGYNRQLELFQQGVAFGLIEKSGAWYNIGDQKAQGGAGFQAMLLENPIMASELEMAIKEYW